MKELEEYVRSIPGFSEPGIIFRDMANILRNMDGLHMAVDSLIDMVRDLGYDLVVGPKSRGFIFGVSVVYTQCKRFMPVYKKGKLPCETIAMEYDLEYGQTIIEMRKGIIRPSQRVITVDDLITTRGATEAIVELIRQLGGQVVKICFVMELVGLSGRKHLKGYDVDSATVYEGK